MLHCYQSSSDSSIPKVTPQCAQIIDEWRPSSLAPSHNFDFKGKGKGKFEVRVGVMEVRATSSRTSTSTSSSSGSYVGCNDLDFKYKPEALDAADLMSYEERNTDSIAEEEEKNIFWKDMEMKPSAAALDLQRCKEDLERAAQLAKDMIKEYQSPRPRHSRTATRRLYDFMRGSRHPSVHEGTTNSSSRTGQLKLAVLQYELSRENFLRARSKRTQECKDFKKRLCSVIVAIRAKTEEFEAVEKQLDDAVEKLGDEEGDFELEEADEALFEVQIRSENILEELGVLGEERDRLLERQIFYTES